MLTSEKPIGRDILIWLQYTEGYTPKVTYEQTVQSPSDFDDHQMSVLAQSMLNSGLMNIQETERLLEVGFAGEN
jgi:hypothetical protein